MAKNDKLGKLLLGSALGRRCYRLPLLIFLRKKGRTAPGMTKIWKISMTI